MPLKITRGRCVLSGAATIEDAEPLVGWLAGHPEKAVDISAATYLHTAVLQVIAASGFRMKGEPADRFSAEAIASLKNRE